MATWTMSFDDIIEYYGSMRNLLTDRQNADIGLTPLFTRKKVNSVTLWEPMTTEDLQELFITRYGDSEIASETTYAFERSFQRTWDKAYQAIAQQQQAQISLLQKSADELLQKEKETLSRTYAQNADAESDRIYSDTPNEKLAIDGQDGYYTDRTYTTNGTSGSGNEEYTRLRSDNQAKQYLEILKVFEDLNQKFLDSFEDLFLDFYVLEDLTLKPKRRF